VIVARFDGDAFPVDNEEEQRPCDIADFLDCD
jgi:hypothetical protein